jgi:thymidylate kinase
MAKLRCRLQGDLKNKMLESGGAVIAIVGADATGKSTLVSETERWLGKIFAVRKVHVGKPPSTLLTLPLNIMLPLSRRLFPHLRRSHVPPKPADLPEKPETEKVPASLFFAVRALGLAWDRHRLLVKVAHARSKGELIICDRYPSEQTGAMDSPRLAQKADQKGLKAAIFNRLAGMENRLYSRMPPPDIAVRLTVPLETAIRRNQARIKSDKDSDEFIEVRHQRAGRWHKKDTKHYFEIDTEQSLAATILKIKKVIWESL